MKNEAIWMAAVAAVAGFTLGRWTAKDGTVINVAPAVGEGEPMGPLELPPPPIPEPLGDRPSGHYAKRWDGVDFEFDIYPVGADRTRISPPTGAGKAAAAEDCSIIAIPDGWWDRAGTIADQALAAGENDAQALADAVLNGGLAECAYADTEATRQLRDEIASKLAEGIPGVVFPPPPPPPSSIALRNYRYPPTLGPARPRGRGRGRRGRRGRRA